MASEQNELEKIQARDSHENLLWVGAVIKGLQHDRFYGEVNLILVEGRIVRIEKKQSLLPPTG